MKQNLYTAKDIERYHRGELSAAEMHSLEKEALDDPFLADALEGYALTQTPSSDLTALKQRLQNRVLKEDKKTPVFSLGVNWMKIAALFILIAGGGWLIFQTFSDKKQDLATTSKQEKEAPANQNNSSSTPSLTTSTNEVTDSINFRAETTTEEDQSIVQNNLRQKKGKAPAKDVTLFAPDDPVIVQSSPPASINRPVANDSLKPDVYARFEPNLSKFKAIDSSVARKDGDIRETLAGKVRGVTTQNDTLKNLDVVMQRSNETMDEVVITKSTAKPEAKRRMQVKVDTLQPAEGWTNFDDYIASNMRMPEQFRAKPVSGEVELAFDVSKKGEPINITVTKSLCEKCDEEAVRLLKEGPKWKNNKKKGKVTIRF